MFVYLVSAIVFTIMLSSVLIAFPKLCYKKIIHLVVLSAFLIAVIVQLLYSFYSLTYAILSLFPLLFVAYIIIERQNTDVKLEGTGEVLENIDAVAESTLPPDESIIEPVDLPKMDQAEEENDEDPEDTFTLESVYESATDDIIDENTQLNELVIDWQEESFLAEKEEVEEKKETVGSYVEKQEELVDIQVQHDEEFFNYEKDVSILPSTFTNELFDIQPKVLEEQDNRVEETTIRKELMDNLYDLDDEFSDPIELLDENFVKENEIQILSDSPEIKQMTDVTESISEQINIEKRADVQPLQLESKKEKESVLEIRKSLFEELEKDL